MEDKREYGITIEYFSESEFHPYKARAKYEINSDATLYDAIKTFLEVLTVAGYRVTSSDLYEIADEFLEEEEYITTKILNRNKEEFEK